MPKYKSTLETHAGTLYEYPARPGATCAKCHATIPAGTPLFWEPPSCRHGPNNSYCPTCAQRAADSLAQCRDDCAWEDILPSSW